MASFKTKLKKKNQFVNFITFKVLVVLAQKTYSHNGQWCHLNKANDTT